MDVVSYEAGKVCR